MYSLTSILSNSVNRFRSVIRLLSMFEFIKTKISHTRDDMNTEVNCL